MAKPVRKPESEAQIPESQRPAGRLRFSAWIIHGLSACFMGIAIGCLNAGAGAQEAVAFGLVCLTTSIVICLWSLVLAVRALKEEPPLPSRCLLVLLLFELAVPTFVLWSHVLNWPWNCRNESRLIVWTMEYGIPIILTVLTFGLALAWINTSCIAYALSAIRAKRAKASPQRLSTLTKTAAFCGSWLLASVLVFPVPMILLGVFVGPYLSTNSWQEQWARRMPHLAGDALSEICRLPASGRRRTYLWQALFKSGCISTARAKELLEDPVFSDSIDAWKTTQKYYPEIILEYILDISQGRCKAGKYMQREAARWLVNNHPSDLPTRIKFLSSLLDDPNANDTFLGLLLVECSSKIDLRPAAERLVFTRKNLSDEIIHALDDYVPASTPGTEDFERKSLYVNWSLARFARGKAFTPPQFAHTWSTVESALACLESSKFRTNRRLSAVILAETVDFKLQYSPVGSGFLSDPESDLEQKEVQSLKLAAYGWAKPEHVKSLLAEAGNIDISDSVWNRICLQYPEVGLSYAQDACDGRVSKPALEAAGRIMGRLGEAARLNAILDRRTTVPQNFITNMLKESPKKTLRGLIENLRLMAGEDSPITLTALRALSEVEESSLLAQRFSKLVETNAGALRVARVIADIEEMDLRASTVLVLLHTNGQKARRFAANEAFLSVDCDKLNRPIVRRRWVENLRLFLSDQDGVVRRASVRLLGLMLKVPTPATTFPNDAGSGRYVLYGSDEPVPETQDEAAEREKIASAASDWLAQDAQASKQ